MNAVVEMEENHLKGLNGTKVEEYNYSKTDFVYPGITWKDRRKLEDNGSFLSNFDTALRCRWVEKMKLGLFRYSLWSLQTKILTGSVRYVAQLNIKRGVERRKPEDIRSIQQKFNSRQFNFNMIKPEEILFQMSRSSAENADEECIDQGSGYNNVEPSMSSKCKSNSTLVAINISPLEFGHVLFIPDPSLCLPQILTQDLMWFGLESVLLSSHPGFRVGFNSLGGFASVNHLHLHGFYLDHELLIESSCSKPLVPEINFHLLTDFPAPGFFFYTDGKDLEYVAQNICRVTDFLVGKNIAHNLFVTRGSKPGSMRWSEAREGVRIVIWARKTCFGAKEESAFNVALCELAGHLPIKNQEDFNSLTEETVIHIINQYLMTDDEFTQLSLDLVTHLTN
ncbi:GDP-D-glucose phosphorylase 1 [Rhinophrynus dorsalis]